MTPAQTRFLEHYRIAADKNRFDNRYEVSEYTAEIITGTKKMIVSRTYFPRHAPSVLYRDCLIVGPKGAVRKIVYDRIDV